METPGNESSSKEDHADPATPPVPPKQPPILAPPSYTDTTRTTEPLPITRIEHEDIDFNDPRLRIDGENEDADVEKSEEMQAAPDGGWGWLIVLAAFFINLVLDGIAYSCGVYLPVLMEEFDESASKTAWIGSLCSGCYLAISPIAGAVTNRFGCRKVSIFGCLWASASLALSSFATNLDILIFSWGVSTGLAFGFLYLPSIVIVGLWFERKRGIATGITVAGTGVGLFVLPPLCTLMIDRWGWRNSLYGLGGLVFLCTPLALLYRDVPPTYINGQKRKTSTVAKDGTSSGAKVSLENEVMITVKDHDADDESRDIVGSSRSSLQDASSSDKRTTVHSSNPEVARSTNSVDAKNKNDKSKMNPLLKRALLNNAQSTGAVNSDSDQVSAAQTAPADCTSPQRHSMDCLSANLLLRDSSSEPPQAGPRRRAGSSNHSRFLSDEPLRRKDLFLSVSTVNLSENTANAKPTSVSFEGSRRSVDQSEARLHKKMRHNKFVSGLLRMLGVEVFTHKCFILLLLTSFLAFLGFHTPFIYITDYASINGVDTNSAAFLISITGIANTVGRPLVGFMVSMRWADSVVLLNGSLVCAGVLTIGLPFLHAYWALAIYASLFGLSVAAQICVRSLAIVQLMGVERLTSAFGFSLLAIGVAAMIGVPINGLFYDEESQSYTTTFIMAGVFMILAGLLGIPLQKLSNMERKKHPGKFRQIIEPTVKNTPAQEVANDEQNNSRTDIEV